MHQRKQVEPISVDGKGATDTGPRNLAIDEQNSDQCKQTLTILDRPTETEMGDEPRPRSSAED
jgi:hypothetical protein